MDWDLISEVFYGLAPSVPAPSYPSTEMNNFDQTEDYTARDSTGPIRPIMERLLVDASKGAISSIGPTRNSYQPANAMLARAVVRELSAGLDLGTTP